MKKLWLLLCVVFVFTSCSKDDEAGIDERFKTLDSLTEQENSFLGTWEMTSYESSQMTDFIGDVVTITQEGSDLDYSFTFYNDKTYEYGGSFVVNSTTDFGDGVLLPSQSLAEIPNGSGTWQEVDGEVVVDGYALSVDGSTSTTTEIYDLPVDLSWTVNGDNMNFLIEMNYTEFGVTTSQITTQSYQKQ